MGRKKIDKAEELRVLFRRINEGEITNQDIKKIVSKLNQPKKLKYTKWDTKKK